MMATRGGRKIIAFGALVLAWVPLCAQQAAKKSFAFRGRVEAVDSAAKRITVANEPIEGWMGAMTMVYAVDNGDILNRVKVGDRITATVYEGESKLYNVQIAPEARAAGEQGSAEKDGLRLPDLEEMALANNPTMAQVQANLQVAAGLVRQSSLYPNPTVGYYGDEIRGGYIGGGKQGGFISQTIVLGGKLGAARRAAQLAAKEIEAGGQIQRVRILNNVHALFYQALAAQRLVEVRQRLAKLADDAVQTSYQLGNVGQADRPDILQAEVERQQANVSLRVAQQNLQASWRILGAVVGNSGLRITRLEGDLDAVPNLDYEESLRTVLRDSPEVKLAQQSIDRAEALLLQARKAPIPDLQLTGILTQNYEPLDPTRRATGLMGGAQVGVQLPIFDRNQGNIAAAKGEIENAKQEAFRVKLTLERDIADLFRDYDAARITVQEYKTEMLPRAEQAYKLYQANYQNMAGAYPQVLISQRTLFQLEADYIEALDQAWQSALLIQGFGLRDGLAAPGSSPMPHSAGPGSRVGGLIQ